MTADVQDAYARGVLDGRVAVRLDQHDAQLAAIIDTSARTVEITHTLTLAVQSLDEGAIARDKTTLATAAALKLAKEEKESSDDHGWSPVAKLISTLGSVAVLWTILDAVMR